MERLNACQRENGSSFGGQSCMLLYQSQRRGVDPPAPCRGRERVMAACLHHLQGQVQRQSLGMGLVGCICWSCQTPVDMLRTHAVETGKVVKAVRHERRSEGASQHKNWRNTGQATGYFFPQNVLCCKFLTSDFSLIAIYNYQNLLWSLIGQQCPFGFKNFGKVRKCKV